jgi:hypothetical protein
VAQSIFNEALSGLNTLEKSHRELIAASYRQRASSTALSPFRGGQRLVNERVYESRPLIATTRSSVLGDRHTANAGGDARRIGASASRAG